jgi:hypothetical protein
MIGIISAIIVNGAVLLGSFLSKQWELVISNLTRLALAYLVVFAPPSYLLNAILLLAAVSTTIIYTVCSPSRSLFSRLPRHHMIHLITSLPFLCLLQLLFLPFCLSSSLRLLMSLQTLLVRADILTNLLQA